MLKSIFATKIGMSQAWDTAGKRFAVTKCKVSPNIVIAQQDSITPTYLIGFGNKKLANMSKPLRTIISKSGFSFGVKKIKGIQADTTDLKAGDTVALDTVIKVGDVVKVRGTTKGRGFGGVVKRHGFHGGPKTHGQSDRLRAPGSIGSGTTPGRVLKGKRMAGHYGNVMQTVSGLVVLHIDPDKQEVWLSGPVPGSLTATIEISPTGETKTVELNTAASGISVKAVEPMVNEPEAEVPTQEAATTETK